MTRWNDEQLDALMGEFFSARLDPQVGRAARSVPVRRSMLFRPWFLAAAGGAVAACLAVGWVLFPRGNPPGPVPPAIEPPKLADNRPVEVQRSTQWQAWDGGTIAVDEHTPARVLRRRQVDRVQWLDPVTGARIETSEPHDEVILVGLHPY